MKSRGDMKAFLFPIILLSAFATEANEYSNANTLTEKHLTNQENFISFMAGLTIAKVDLNIISNAPFDNQTFQTNVDYILSDTWLKGMNFSGRVGSFPIVIQYLQNKAETIVAEEIDKQGVKSLKAIKQAASKSLLATIDFAGLFSQSSSTQLNLSDIRINGHANITDFVGVQTAQAFSTHLKRSSIRVIEESGVYMGAEFKTLSTPTKLGFSDYKRKTVLTAVDNQSKYQSLNFLYGYDHTVFIKNNKLNYHNFYWSGNVSVGMGKLETSPEFEQYVLDTTSSKRLSGSNHVVEAGADLEVGYMWQKRIQRWDNFGYSLGAGYLVSGLYAEVSRSKDAQLTQGTLYRNIGYALFTHGPFFKINVMF